MSIRALTALAVLATVIVLTPALPFSQEQEEGTLIHCGEQYMTVMATAVVIGGQRMDAGPVTFVYNSPNLDADWGSILNAD